MSEAISSDKVNGVTILGIGGTGVNTISNLDIPQNRTGISNTNLIALDLAESNLNDTLVNKATFIKVKGSDGSGQDRKLAYKVIKKSLNSILLNNTFNDVVIIVGSISGGTGSAGIPLFTRELIARNHTVLLLLVESDDSATRINANYATMATLQAITKKNKGKGIGKTVIFGWFSNNEQTPRSRVDVEVATYISALTALFSGDNGELDSEDLANWIYLNTVKEVSPALGLLKILKEDNTSEGLRKLEEDAKDFHTISSVSLFNDADGLIPKLNQLYTTHGVKPATCLASQKEADNSNWHFLISYVSTSEIINDLGKKKKAAMEAIEAAIQPLISDISECADDWD